MKPTWLAVLFFITLGGPSRADEFPVTIDVDAGKPLGELKPIWRMFGADEPNYTTMRNGRKLTRELCELRPNDVYFRAHNLLSSGDGTPALKWGSTGAYTEDANGAPRYSWKILDQIFDTYRDSKVRPYVEIGFMPEAMSIHPEPYQHSWNPSARYNQIATGWAYPPKDYEKWRELVSQWVRHCVERYGRGEVEKWYWEVWNEPNILYWQGTREEFFKLHDYAIDGVRRALPTARVGGPDSAGPGGDWSRAFLEHCLRGTNFSTGKIGTPIDFFSFHAKGSPSFTNGHVRMGIANQLRNIDSGFALLKSYPELQHIPIVIGESDPDGCAACQGPQLGYRNTTMYSSYTAASFARKWELARLHGVNLDAALTWAFTFEDQPLFAGFRQLASGGIDLPVLNVFRMFSKMSGQQLAVTSDSALSLDDIKRSGATNQPDVSAIAALDKNHLTILLWHYHDDDVAGADGAVRLNLRGITKRNGKASVTRYAIDSSHTNPFEVWKQMGSPAQPTAQQYQQLENTGHLTKIDAPESVEIKKGEAVLNVTLPSQAVWLLQIKL